MPWVGLMRRRLKVMAKKEGTETHRQYNCPAWREARDQVPEELRRRKKELVVGQCAA